MTHDRSIRRGLRGLPAAAQSVTGSRRPAGIRNHFLVLEADRADVPACRVQQLADGIRSATALRKVATPLSGGA